MALLFDFTLEDCFVNLSFQQSSKNPDTGQFSSVKESSLNLENTTASYEPKFYSNDDGTVHVDEVSGTRKFSFDQNMLHLCPSLNHGHINLKRISDFNEVLRSRWDFANSQGYLRYYMKKDLPFRILPGKFNLIVLMNPDRLNRRKPQTITSPNQPFNPSDFNFNKADEREILMTLRFLNHDDGISTEKNVRILEAEILVNVSPVSYGNVLIVPNMKDNEPQCITKDGLRLSVLTLLLNSSSDFRVGFNSLCGYASVNHHHYHGYYLCHRLYIEFAELKSICSRCFVLKDEEYPAQGFVFVLRDSSNNNLAVNLNEFITDVFKFISFLQKSNIAHNLYLTRGSSRNLKNHFDSIRLYIWGRQSSFGKANKRLLMFYPEQSSIAFVKFFVEGAKEINTLNPALCEFAGHFPVKYETVFNTITEDDIRNNLKNICYEQFQELCSQITTLYS